MLNSHIYGIDPGSSIVKIYSRQSDEIIKEKNMIAIRNREDILAAGNEAYEMFEKNPANVTVSSPMSGGMIANISYLRLCSTIFCAGRDAEWGVIRSFTLRSLWI